MSAIRAYLARSEMEALIIKGLFEGAGIKSTISPVSSLSPQGYLAGPSGFFGVYASYIVYVPEKDADEARKVLAERE